MNPSCLTKHNAVLSWNHDQCVQLLNKASSSFEIIKSAIYKMLAEVFYCSFRCLRLVKNILSMWSLGILYQNGDTGQDSKETEQCFKS